MLDYNPADGTIFVPYQLGPTRAAHLEHDGVTYRLVIPDEYVSGTRMPVILRGQISAGATPAGSFGSPHSDHRFAYSRGSERGSLTASMRRKDSRIVNLEAELKEARSAIVKREDELCRLRHEIRVTQELGEMRMELAQKDLEIASMRNELETVQRSFEVQERRVGSGESQNKKLQNLLRELIDASSSEGPECPRTEEGLACKGSKDCEHCDGEVGAARSGDKRKAPRHADDDRALPATAAPPDEAVHMASVLLSARQTETVGVLKAVSADAGARVAEACRRAFSCDSTRRPRDVRDLASSRVQPAVVPQRALSPAIDASATNNVCRRVSQTRASGASATAPSPNIVPAVAPRQFVSPVQMLRGTRSTLPAALTLRPSADNLFWQHGSKGLLQAGPCPTSPRGQATTALWSAASYSAPSARAATGAQQVEGTAALRLPASAPQVRLNEGGAIQWPSEAKSRAHSPSPPLTSSGRTAAFAPKFTCKSVQLPMARKTIGSVPQNLAVQDGLPKLTPRTALLGHVPWSHLGA